MIYESALVTFSDGEQLRIPLVSGPNRERTWEQMARFACAYALVNTGKRYEIKDVVSVRVREGTDG